MTSYDFCDLAALRLWSGQALREIFQNSVAALAVQGNTDNSTSLEL